MPAASTATIINAYRREDPEPADPEPVLFAEIDLEQDTESATHQSQELRLSTPDDWRVRAHWRRVLGRIQDR